jgi:phosphinothricin acetyltransferase
VVPTRADWNDGHLEKCRLVAEIVNQIIGSATLTPVSDRCIYAGIAVVGIYVAGPYRGRKLVPAFFKN